MMENTFHLGTPVIFLVLWQRLDPLSQIAFVGCLSDLCSIDHLLIAYLSRTQATLPFKCQLQFIYGIFLSAIITPFLT